MSYSIVLLLVESDSLDVVEDAQEVCLDCVGVRCLSQDLEQSWVGDEEESREDESLLLQVPSERLLAELKLLEEVREKLTHCLVSYAAGDYVGSLVGLGQDLHPRLVNVAESFGFLHRKSIKMAVIQMRVDYGGTIGSCLAMSPPTNTASR